MSGIYGYCKLGANDGNLLAHMTDEMLLYKHFTHDPDFEDANVAASRVHLGHLGQKTSPQQQDGVFVWIEGEAYNHVEVAKLLKLTRGDFASTLLAAWRANLLDEFLNKLDGYFCAALYDRHAGTLNLISDRYGMRMLYWYFDGARFVWASEVKGILAVPGVDKSVDVSSPDCFMNLGFLIGERTWFEKIKLLNPATVLTYDFRRCQMSSRHYWKWSEIKPSDLSFEEAVDALGDVLKKSVARRFNPDERIGISLSGGLDSRVILAAVHDLYPDYQGYAYTFGRPGCDDIRIAEQVVAKTQWRHERFYFENDNWFEPRVEKIWNTDGMLDMMHMHGGEFVETVATNVDINLNGYAGDAVVGGSFLDRIPHDRRLTCADSIPFYKKYAHLANIESDFYDIKKAEPNLYMNRVRRFTNMGSVNALTHLEQRKPFFDNAVNELVFSLPDSYRFRNRLYSTMLQRHYAEFFKDIPWQKTGKPAGVTKKPWLLIRALRKLESILVSHGLRESSQNFTNYPKWIRSAEVRTRIEKILLNDCALVHQYLPAHVIEQCLDRHMNGTDNSSLILRLVTMEVYLDKVFDQSGKDGGHGRTNTGTLCVEKGAL